MISKMKAFRALSELVERGLLTPDQAKNYEGMIEEAVSYRKLMISELGSLTGELYLKEEEAQHFVLHKIRLPLAKLSVPEVLLAEDDLEMEPWHNERYSESPAKAKFSAEAGEPWHISLLDRFRPDPQVVEWFRKRPRYEGAAERILKIAYGT